MKTGLYAGKFSAFWLFPARKGFITDSFCKLSLYTLQSAKGKWTCAISKNMKTCESE